MRGKLKIVHRKHTGRFIPCTGSAHENPFIDNCGLCAPKWGEMKEMAPIDVDASLDAGFGVPLCELEAEQYARVNALRDAGAVRFESVTEKRSYGSETFFVAVRQ